MNENIDLTKILEGCPVGTEFYHVVYGRVWLTGICLDDDCPIKLSLHNGPYTNTTLTKKGTFSKKYGGGCLLFPSKDQRDWSKFQPKKPKFDPKTLLPFDRVLAKRGYESYHTWYPDFICRPTTDIDDTIFCIGIRDVAIVIPYNDDTKHLVGTTDEAPEYYRYWED